MWRLSDADGDGSHVKVSPVDHSPRTFEFSGENHERTEHTTDVISKYTRPREELKGKYLKFGTLNSWHERNEVPSALGVRTERIEEIIDRNPIIQSGL